MPITINGLTGISGADGSAATPFIRGSDADTGLYFPSAGNAAISINGSQALLVDNSNNVTMTGNLTIAGTMTAANSNVTGTVVMSSSFKRNRIINGNMLIDQRNAGANVTITTSGQYALDRFCYFVSQSSKFTTQQNQGSVTPPVGFSTYVGMTVGASANVTISASDNFGIRQMIEGYNIADLGWGTSNAKTIIFSFWVRSSLTGTFGGALCNSAGDRSYAYTYTINAANTWEYKTVTVAGCTDGTWNTTTGVGIELRIAIGAGSNWTGTAGSWASANYVSATGATNLITTNSATFYITGVQLEVGTKATPYEMQIYSDQFSQCQRYYEKGSIKSYIGGASATSIAISSIFKVTKRSSPTMSYGTSGSRSYVPDSTEWAETESFGCLRNSNEIAATWIASAEL
jgi:hypothetical protein